MPTLPGNVNFGTGLRELRCLETHSLPTLARCYPRSFTFYVAHPIRSILSIDNWMQRHVAYSLGGSAIVFSPTRAKYSSAWSKSVPARPMIFKRLSIDETSSHCSVRNHCKKLIVM